MIVEEVVGLGLTVLDDSNVDRSSTRDRLHLASSGLDRSSVKSLVILVVVSVARPVSQWCLLSGLVVFIHHSKLLTLPITDSGHT